MQERLTGTRVLIVDDDVDIAESFQAAFEAEGAETAVANDGNQGVTLCRELEPDLVVLDMMLPGRSGFLALEKIKGNENSPFVIMVTANEGKRHQEYAEALGVDDYMLKPVPLENLITRVVQLVQSHPKA